MGVESSVDELKTSIRGGKLRRVTLYIFVLLTLLIGVTFGQRRRSRFKRGGGPQRVVKLMEEGNFSEAARLMERFLSRPRATRKDSLKVMRNLAICYTALERWSDAERAYRWLSRNDRRGEVKWRELAEIVSQPSKGLKPEHLPQSVNSKLGEIMPVISPDGKTLYFIVDDGKDQDIYYSTLDQDGNWSPRKPIGPPLNTEFSDGILSVLPDGNTVLLNGIYRQDGTKDAGYSLSNNLGDKWSFPRAVEIDDYYNKNRYTSACLASDGRTLLLAVERDDSYGDLDIYVSFRKEDGTFTKPENLGPTINTSGTDGTPFLASDGITLYFSSDGHPTLGNADMFVAKRLDDTWKNWSIPKNMGKELNTVGWDAYYTIPATGDYVYFVSSGKDALGGTDIFRVKLPKEVKPEPVVTIEGTVSDENGKPIAADIKYERLSDGKNLGIASSNPKTGYYSIVLPTGEKYGYSISKDGYLFQSDHIDLTNVKEYSKIRKDIVLKPVKVGSQIVLHNIFFEFNSAELQPESIGELERVLEIMKDNPKISVEIAGHTDSIGTEGYNQKLSQERAEAVAQWLVEHGIDEGRIVARGYGESQPVADNGTEEGRAQNRRVTFTIIKK